jgi:hypothetical protein
MGVGWMPDLSDLSDLFDCWEFSVLAWLRLSIIDEGRDPVVAEDAVPLELSDICDVEDS